MAFLRDNNHTAYTTPIVEKSAGVRPAQHFKPAPYLPLVRFEPMIGDHKVISTGKVLAVDGNNFIVPAGLAIDIQTALDGVQDHDGSATSIKTQLMTIEANTPGTFGLVYTATDVTYGVKNFAGDTVVAGEPVCASFLKSGAVNYKTTNGATDWTQVTGGTVGKPIGIAPYDVWRNNSTTTGNQSNNPNNFRNTNWNMQQGLSVLTRYFIEVPVVANTSGLVYPGLTVFEGTPSHGLVTFNKNSNFCMLSDLARSSEDAYTTTAATDAELKAEFDRVINHLNTVSGGVLGRVLFIDTDFPKDYLDYVKTWSPNITNPVGTDNVPGTATLGLPDNLTYAGVTSVGSAKVVRINIVI